MKRAVLLLLVFTMSLFALDVTSSKTLIYDKIEILENVHSIEEAIKNRDNFKLKKYFPRYLEQRPNNDNLWVKINIKNPSHKNLNKVLISKWFNITLDLYVVKNQTIIFKDTIEDDKKFLKVSNSFTIPKNSTYELYIHAKNKDFFDLYHYIFIVDNSIKKDFVLFKEKMYNYGFLFGVLLAMTMYSFFMFFSIRKKEYLYLGIYQLWVMIGTSGLMPYLYSALESSPFLAKFLLKDLYQFSMMFLSVLFVKEFLNTKEKYPKTHLLIYIVLFIIFILNFINSEVNYATCLYSIFVFIGFYAFYKKDIAALFFSIGFLGFSLLGLFNNLEKIFEWGILRLDFAETRLILACFESFIMVFAIYIKLRKIMNDKRKAQEEAAKHEKMLLEQSRLASMGELLASISHQWKQPLNHLTMINANLQLANESKMLNEAYLNKKLDESNRQLKYMANTIENFNSYLSQKHTKYEFLLEELSQEAIDLVATRVKNHNIKISTQCLFYNSVFNYKNELLQIVLIILNNAIDALVSNNSENRYINIIIKKNQVVIEDNAGGIPDEILSKIFDPYFSTKDKKHGTGIGLYSAQTLMNKLIKGSITVKNNDFGATFYINIS